MKSSIMKNKSQSYEEEKVHNSQYMCEDEIFSLYTSPHSLFNAKFFFDLFIRSRNFKAEEIKKL
jgi:hypothetical protein